jgi:hypothetical protein
MGDRANVIFKQSNGTFLGAYLHNGGYNIEERAAKALKRVLNAGRQQDESYANRIALSEMVANEWEQDYSYGVNVGLTMNDAMGDNERDIILVDWKSLKVNIHEFDHEKREVREEIKDTFSFNEFIENKLSVKTAN